MSIGTGSTPSSVQSLRSERDVLPQCWRELLYEEVGFLMSRWNKNEVPSMSPPTRSFRKLYFCGLPPLSFQSPLSLCAAKEEVPFCFQQSSKKASAQSFHSMLGHSLIQHQTSCSPLVHGVWGRGGHMAMEETLAGGAQPKDQRADRARRRESSFV